MSDLTNVFTDIADAIRAKTEAQITYKPTEMADAINNIETGGGALVYDANGLSIQQWFNAPVTIAEGVTSTFNMFLNCNNFNQPVTIPNSVTTTFNMFRNCRSFNQPVTIPNSVTVVTNMFSDCLSFNQPVTIPNSVTSTFNMFRGCRRFNQPVTIPSSVQATADMFNSCTNLNQPVIISDNATNMLSMFYNCTNFNQFVSVPSKVHYASTMFLNCRSFNQPVIISNSAYTIYSMFTNCTNFGSNIYVGAQNLSRQDVAYMFQGCNNQLQKHIFTDYTGVFSGTSASQSVTGTEITWTQDGDNYYNTAYNIYIHNVANPYTVLNNAEYHFSSSSPIPDSPAIVFGSGVRNLYHAFDNVSLNSNNTLILFEEGVENLAWCFASQLHLMFNQPVTIPSSAKDCSDIFLNCGNLNSDIVFRNGVENVSEAICNCQNFASNIWIPESVTDMAWLLDDTPYASGTVHISHNIALGNTDNYIYNSLVNGEAGVILDPSRILNDY